MTLNILLLTFSGLLALGAFPIWPYSANWGYLPSGGLGMVALVLFFMILAERANMNSKKPRKL